MFANYPNTSIGNLFGNADTRNKIKETPQNPFWASFLYMAEF